ncbi:hypothetical protein Q7P35_006679 [Cladosporium inversicolor]
MLDLKAPLIRGESEFVPIFALFNIIQIPETPRQNHPERTASENALLRKENTEFRELLRVRKESKKGKRVAFKGKFVFNTKEILELVEEAEAEASKGKLKKRRTTRATTPEIEDEEEEGIEETTKLSKTTTAKKTGDMTNDVNIRGPISLDQLKQETKRVTFGIELECIAVYPLELFEDDDRNARGDAIAALSLACMDRGIKSSGREDIDDEEEWHLNSEPSYSMFCFAQAATA